MTSIPYKPKKYHNEYEEDFDRAATLALCLPYHIEEYPDYYEYGVPHYEPKDPAEHAALIILRNMLDRSGIKSQLNNVDYDTREEIVAYMRAAINHTTNTRKEPTQ